MSIGDAVTAALALAKQHHRAGRRDAAHTAYLAALQHDPACVEALHLLGVRMLQAGQGDRGLAWLARCLRIDPSRRDARIDRAEALKAAGLPAEALAAWQDILEREPDLALGWFRSGQIHLAGGSSRLPAAIGRLERAATIAPDQADLQQQLGFALREANRLGEAADRFRRAIAARPDFTQAFMSLGNARLAQGDAVAAVACLQAALQLNPDAPECWYNLGNARHTLADLAGALTAFGRALRFGLPQAWERLAAVLMDLGRAREAEAVLLELTARAGGNDEPLTEELVKLMLREGRTAEARARFTERLNAARNGRAVAEAMIALAAVELADDRPRAALTLVQSIGGDSGWLFAVRSLAALRTSLAEQGASVPRPRSLPPGPRRVTSSSLATRGRFAHTVMEYVLVRLYAEKHGLVFETPDWPGGLFFDLDDPPQSGRLPPLVMGRVLLNEGLASDARRPPVADRDIISPLFLFEHRLAYRERVQTWLRPRAIWRPYLDPAIERLRARGGTIVALHLRRGDFVSAGYPITETDWYVTWLRALWPTLDRPVLYLASDDLPAVRAAFAEFQPVVRTDVVADWPSLDFLQDFHVLTQADVVGISAASGFSQLAARLNRRAHTFAEPDVVARAIRPFVPWTP